jgi:glyoxylase-like metal-dependent hydrolase (beta-lactamase superfamily II)
MNMRVSSSNTDAAYGNHGVTVQKRRRTGRRIQSREVSMTRKCLAVAALTFLVAGAASAQDARTVVANTTKAMGYANLNTIEYSGPTSLEGIGLGQWMSPAKGWHRNTVTEFKRFMDYNAGTSQRTGMQSRPGDPSGLLPGGGGLDPSNAPPAQNTQQVSATDGWAQRLEVTLSPPNFLRLAARATNPTMRNQSVGGKRYRVISFPVDQKAPSGLPYTLTGYISNDNMLERVETAYEDAAPYMIGDVLVEQIYSDFKDFGGVKFPTKITQNRAGVLYNEATIASVVPNAAAPPAPAPGGGPRGGGAGAPGAGGRGAGAPGAAAPGGAAGGRGAGAPAAGGAQRGAGGGGQAAALPSPRKLADGVWVVTSGYRVLAVEFKDHVVLIDAPQNGIATMISQVKEAIPNKPITHVILTHNHFDHSGGLRTVLAEGKEPVTLVAHEMTKPVVEKWFSNPRTLQAAVPAPGAAAAAAPAPTGGGRGGAAPAPWPDALAQSGKKTRFQWVKDKLVLKDDTRTIEVHHIKGALHSEDMVVVYLPKEKVIYEADAYNPGAVGAVTTGRGQLAFQKLLADELDRLKIDYTTIVSGHAPPGGRDATKQDLMVAIGRVPPPAPAPGAATPGRGQN